MFRKFLAELVVLRLWAQERLAHLPGMGKAPWWR